MPVLFFFRTLSLLLTGNDQLVFIKADLDILLVHPRKSGGHFESIFCFRHTNCWRTCPNVARIRTLIESTKRVFHFAPYRAEWVQLLATRRPQSRKAHLFSPSLREYIQNLCC